MWGQTLVVYASMRLRADGRLGQEAVRGCLHGLRFNFVTVEKYPSWPTRWTGGPCVSVGAEGAASRSAPTTMPITPVHTVWVRVVLWPGHSMQKTCLTIRANHMRAYIASDRCNETALAHPYYNLKHLVLGQHDM